MSRRKHARHRHVEDKDIPILSPMVVAFLILRHDLHATMLTLLGIDHEKLTYLFEGRNRRLTDV